MKKMRKSNRGFTLIELIIAMAILAFLMTAVSAFMGSGVMSFRKAKADQAVNTAAQTVYDQLADCIMGANRVYVYAYLATDTTQNMDFSKPGEAANVGLAGPYYFVRDTESVATLQAMKEFVTGTSIRGFDSLKSTDKLYVKAIIVDKAVELDDDYFAGAGTYTNQLTKEEVEVKAKERLDEVDEEGNETTSPTVHSSIGKLVYNIKDTERNIFTFDEGKLYYQKEYAIMTALNDKAATDSKMRDYLFSDAFSYVTYTEAGSTDTLPGFVMNVDPSNGAVSFDLQFNDKNMTYKGKGMMNIRNSSVLVPKKSQKDLLIDSGGEDSSEESGEGGDADSTEPPAGEGDDSGDADPAEPPAGEGE